MNAALRELDAEIARVDAEIVAALNRRYALTARRREARLRQNLPARDEADERATLQRVLAATPPAERDTTCAVYERLFAGAGGIIEVIARGVCIHDGRVLLCRAKNAQTTYLPGGHVEFGETARQALVREMREETAHVATAGRFLGVVENAFDQHGKRHCEINLVYEMSVAEPETVASAEAWIDFAWCPLAELSSAGLRPDEMLKFFVSEDNKEGKTK